MKKFIILTTQRSGSTFFRLHVNNHSNIRCHGEVFLHSSLAKDTFRYYCRENIIRRLIYDLYNGEIFSKYLRLFKVVSYPLVRIIATKYLDRLLYDADFSAPWKNMTTWNDYHPRENLGLDEAVGFKLMYNHLDNYRFLSDWILNEDVMIIHLVRKNLLKIYLSRLASKRRQVAHSVQTVDPIKLYIDPKTCAEHIKKIEKRQNNARVLLENKTYIEVSYQEFVHNRLASLSKVFEFLDVEDKVIEYSGANLKKLNPTSLKEIIENYYEVKETLQGTPYERFL